MSPTTLRSHGDDVGAADNENTLVFNQLAVLDEENTSVDVQDFALSTFTAMLFNVVFVPDLVAITVGGYSETILAYGLRHSSVEELTNIAVLINHIQNFTVNANHAANC